MSIESPFRWEEAEADATQTLDLSPRNMEALFRRGLARKGLGKLDQARKGKDSTVVLSVLSLTIHQMFRCSLTAEAIRP